MIDSGFTITCSGNTANKSYLEGSEFSSIEDCMAAIEADVRQSDADYDDYTIHVAGDLYSVSRGVYRASELRQYTPKANMGDSVDFALGRGRGRATGKITHVFADSEHRYFVVQEFTPKGKLSISERKRHYLGLDRLNTVSIFHWQAL